MTHEDQILHELGQLREQIARQQLPMRHGWLKHVIKDFETNPLTQYKVHLYGVVYWLINFPLVCVLFFLFPHVWLKWGIFITLVYSLYANFATDYGAMSSAMAAQGMTPPPVIPLEPSMEEPTDATS